MFQNVKKRLKNQRGLTLVELLAVIVILGIISAIAIPSIGGIIQKSKEDAIKADAIAVLNAAKLHISSTNLSPDTASGDTITMNQDVLSEYVESKYFNTESGAIPFNVVYTISEKSYKLTTTGGITEGGETITFTNATLKDINDDKEKGTRTIPAPSTGG